MIDRKKKIRITQIILLIFGSLVIIFTYVVREKSSQETIIPKATQEKIKKQLGDQANNSDVFFKIRYSGLDLAGNRYILKAEEAITNKNNQKLVNLKFVEAIFYFKDDSILQVWSDEGVYNNETLDMSFRRDVKAIYEGSKLFAQKADYSNSKSFLTISEKVKVIDSMGTMVADKLLFDIKKQTLNIASVNDGKVNANINLK
jgi:Uncharacterized protein conserved in bacteria